MFWMRTLAVVTMMVVASHASAEYSDPYAGLYNTGGYNLLGFGNDLYGASNYLNSSYGGYGGYDSYGGGCASFYGSCSDSYSSAGLYGDSWGSYGGGYGGYGGYGSTYGGYGGYGLDLGIDISLYDSGYGYGSDYYGLGYNDYYGGNSCGYGYSYGYGGGYGSSCGGYGGGGYYDTGCSIGYCSGGSSPYYGGGYGSNWNYGYSPINITININNYLYPSSYYTPQTTIPSYGNCGGGIITCPSGPITRVDPPRYNPPVPPLVPPTNPNPTTPPTQRYVPTDPVRFEVPRGATTHR